MDQATRLFVRERAGERCEYCQRTQAESPMAKLQVEHILPIKHGGGDDLARAGRGRPGLARRGLWARGVCRWRGRAAAGVVESWGPVSRPVCVAVPAAL
jgi:hypothetical protein